jgi:serine/threonine-protein kinase HipA
VKLGPGAALRVLLAFAPDRVLPVGRLALDRGRAVLEYDPAFLASGLSINPRLGPPGSELVWAQEPRIFAGLHGVFADSLPDAWGRELMRRRAIAGGIDPSSLSVLDQLATVGRRGMGALIYEPAAPAEDVHEIDLDVLSSGALDLLDRHNDDLLATLEELGGSSGGARPKILVAIDAAGDIRAGTGTLPAGCDAWIVKFRAPRDRADAGPLEAAYADMARAAGMHVAPTMLLPSRGGGFGYFAAKRFDRRPNGERLHVLSVAGLLETQWEIPNLDYMGLLSATRYVTRDQLDIEQMFRRAVFNVAAHNRDDHAKQHAFLLDAAGSWHLAPAYDLNFSAGPAGEHYLTIAGRGTGITGDDIYALASRQSIPSRAARSIVDEVLSAVSDFEGFAAAYDVPRASYAEITAVLSQHVAEIRSVKPARARPNTKNPEG